jgi:chemotaxis-related protein WspD
MLSDFKTRRRTSPEAVPPAASAEAALAVGLPTARVDCWQQIGVWGDASCPELPIHLHCRNCPVYAAAALRLLDARPPAGYRREWTARIAEPAVATAAGTPMLVFRIGDDWLALGIGVMEEVGEARPIHTLPHRRAGVLLGVVNVRGELLMCVSVGRLLGIEKGVGLGGLLPKASASRLLVVSFQHERYALPVTEVRGVQHLALAETPVDPHTEDRVLRAAGRGRVEWRGQSVCCLDETKLFAALNRSLA